jgi:hypothetical protein
MSSSLRHLLLAATVAILALTASGCGGSASVSMPSGPSPTLALAAADAVTLKGIALDSCSAWRLVSVASIRRDSALAAESFAATEALAARYVVVSVRYSRHRKELPPTMFLPPAQPLIQLELGSCWV